MPSVNQMSWDAAVRHLYGESYAYVATGPRLHEDWVLDVLAVMARAVPDPRGWASVDNDVVGQSPKHPNWPEYPFASHPPEYVAVRLQEIDRGSAENLLLALTEEGCTLSGLQYFDESLDELHAMARTILERYGDEATYHTNVSRTGSSPGTLDFTLETFGYRPLSVLTEDCGLVILSDTEVGLFWNFSD